MPAFVPGLPIIKSAELVVANVALVTVILSVPFTNTFIVFTLPDVIVQAIVIRFHIPVDKTAPLLPI